MSTTDNKLSNNALYANLPPARPIKHDADSFGNPARLPNPATPSFQQSSPLQSSAPPQAQLFAQAQQQRESVTMSAPNLSNYLVGSRPNSQGLNPNKTTGDSFHSTFNWEDAGDEQDKPAGSPRLVPRLGQSKWESDNPFERTLDMVF